MSNVKLAGLAKQFVQKEADREYDLSKPDQQTLFHISSLVGSSRSIEDLIKGIEKMLKQKGDSTNPVDFLIQVLQDNFK